MKPDVRVGSILLGLALSFASGAPGRLSAQSRLEKLEEAGRSTGALGRFEGQRRNLPRSRTQPARIPVQERPAARQSQDDDEEQARLQQERRAARRREREERERRAAPKQSVVTTAEPSGAPSPPQEPERLAEQRNALPANETEAWGAQTIE